MKLYWVAFGFAISMMMGCRTLPDTIAGCQEIFSTEQEIIKCEERVLARDDRRFKEKIAAEEAERMARLCWSAGRQAYDPQTRRCRTNWNRP